MAATSGELNGSAAVEYADRYLIKVYTDPKTWQIEYKNPQTSEKWLMDYPHSEDHGGGSPRLRKVQ